MVKVYYAKLFNFQNEDEERMKVVLEGDFNKLARDFDSAISLLRLYHEGHSPEEQAEVRKETEEFLEECK